MSASNCWVCAGVAVLLCWTQMSTAAAGRSVPAVKLYDGQEMPAIALGTYLGFSLIGVIKPRGDEMRDVIKTAIDVGWRHFDTAAIYATEPDVGGAVSDKILEGKIKREDVFITTKLWNTMHSREQVVVGLTASLQRLGLVYVDLYLIHWPMAHHDNYTTSEIDFMETWRGMEDAQTLGLTRHIGLSNFNLAQTQRVIDEGTVKPAVLQIEINPEIIQTELVNFAQSHDIVVMGYSPFGSMVNRYGLRLPGPKFNDPALVDIANKYGKTPAQVVLRWMVDRNIVPVPKTVQTKRLEENINIFDFKLENSEIQSINAYNVNRRYTLPSFWQNHPYYPFEKVAIPLPAFLGKF